MHLNYFGDFFFSFLPNGLRTPGVFLVGCRIQMGGCSGDPQGDDGYIIAECVATQRVKKKKKKSRVLFAE